MDFLKSDLKGQKPGNITDSPQEIDDRMRRRYLDRLVQRVKVMRKNLVERKWEELRADCAQLTVSGENFRFETITQLAAAARDAIPEGRVTRASHLPDAKPAIEALIAAIDDILIDHSIYRA